MASPQKTRPASPASHAFVLVRIASKWIIPGNGLRRRESVSYDLASDQRLWVARLENGTQLRLGLRPIKQAGVGRQPNLHRVAELLCQLDRRGATADQDRREGVTQIVEAHSLRDPRRRTQACPDLATPLLRPRVIFARRENEVTRLLEGRLQP